MSRFAKVTLDAALDFVHIQYLPAVLESKADVKAFTEEIESGMSKIGRQVDIIVDLGELIVKPSVAALYDESRQRMFTSFARRAYRYSGSPLVRTKILTSSTIHSQSANVFATFEQARDAMLADRARKR